MGRQSLPPGFRFHPTDIELVLYYLKRKLLGKPLTFKAIADVDLYKYAPWELPDKSCLQSRDQEWYFFCPRDRKYTSGPRTNRATETGYWKTTGRDRPVCQEELTVGMKKTLVFHTGRAPKGNRTNWVMHEYRLEDTNLSDAGISLDAYVLCKIFEKSGAGPKNGEQHGAPFKEEDWEEDVVENIVDKSLGPLLLSPPSPVVTANQNIVTENSTLDLPNKAASLIVPPQRDASSDVSVGNLSLPEDPDISTLLEYFQDADSLDDSRIANNKEPIVISNVEGPARMDGYDIFKDLEDIYPRAELQPVDTLHPSDMLQRYGLDPTLIGDDVNYLELNDLDCSVEDPMKAGGSMNREFESFGNRSELDSVDKLYPTDSPYRRANLSCVELNEFERGLLSYPAEAKESEKHASERNFDQYLSSDCFLPIAAFRSGSCLNPPEFSGVFENTTPLMFSDENIGKRSAVPCGYKGDQNPETAGLGKRPSSFAFTGGSFRPYKR